MQCQPSSGKDQHHNTAVPVWQGGSLQGATPALRLLSRRCLSQRQTDGGTEDPRGAGLLGAATAGASIKLGESMTSLEMAMKSPDLPDSVRERIEAVLDTLETGVCQQLGHALKIATASFNDLSEKRWAAAVASTWKGTTLEAKINHNHPASLRQLFRGDVEATALEFADRNRQLYSLLPLKH